MLLTYWNSFRDRFKDLLLSATSEELEKAWTSQSARTHFYASSLLPALAQQLQMEYTTELFKVDFALCATSSSGKKVPLVFIESENNALSATHEVWKLCSLAAPLKVLISCAQWNEDQGYWGTGGQKTKLLEDWGAIIKAHNEVWPQPCIYGIIIGEWCENTLRFYSIGLGANGCALDPHTTLFERQIS